MGQSSYMVFKKEQCGKSWVVFECGMFVQMMGIDGIWCCECIMEDVFESGVKLIIDGLVEGLYLKEFFLFLLFMGLVYCCCELVWVNGDQIGVNFLKVGDKKKKLCFVVVGV